MDDDRFFCCSFDVLSSRKELDKDEKGISCWGDNLRLGYCLVVVIDSNASKTITRFHGKRKIVQSLLMVMMMQQITADSAGFFF